MSGRESRAALAEDTVSICERGWYLSPAGERVELGDSLARAVKHSRTYTPDEATDLLTKRDEILATAARYETNYQVMNTTTLATAAGLCAGRENPPVAALNFASAKHPGGGFLNGAWAQEESLARSSGLYPCLIKQHEYYESNLRCGTALYTDHIIYSPQVPVFRTDDGELHETPYTVSMITAPAVNAGAIKPSEQAQLESVMRRRTELVLAVAVVHEVEELILGAWGCGAFKNSPQQVAGWFAEQLHGPLLGAFRRVVFAVYDYSEAGEMIRPFAAAFTNHQILPSD